MAKKKRSSKADESTPDVSDRPFAEIVGALLKVPVKLKRKKRGTKRTVKSP